MRPFLRRIRVVAAIGFCGFALLWFLSVLAWTGVHIGGTSVSLFPNEIQFKKVDFQGEETQSEMLEVEFSDSEGFDSDESMDETIPGPAFWFETESASQYEATRIVPIHYRRYDSDDGAEIAISISSLVLWFGVVAGVGHFQTMMSMFAGGRIERRGLRRLTQPIKAILFVLTIGTLLMWRYSFSYSLEFGPLAGNPRHDVGLASTYGGFRIQWFHLEISDLGWKQLKEVDSRWNNDPADEERIQVIPERFGMDTYHGPIPLLPKVTQINYFRNPCIPGRCRHGEHCEVVNATQSIQLVWIPYWLIFFIFAFATYRFIWRDRPWPEGMCRGCGFDLRGCESGRCPECGKLRVGSCITISSPADAA